VCIWTRIWGFGLLTSWPELGPSIGHITILRNWIAWSSPHRLESNGRRAQYTVSESLPDVDPFITAGDSPCDVPVEGTPFGYTRDMCAACTLIYINWAKENCLGCLRCRRRHWVTGGRVCHIALFYTDAPTEDHNSISLNIKLSTSGLHHHPIAMYAYVIYAEL
jgi:hypothetical protein